jgi:hypothetical protein
MGILKIDSGTLSVSGTLEVANNIPTTLPLTGSFFDFSTRYHSPGAIPDSDKVTVSLWFKIDPDPTVGIHNFLIQANGGRFFVDYVPGAGGQILIQQWNTAPVKIQDESSGIHTGWKTDLTYHHFLYSRTGTTSHLYIDDVEDSFSKATNSAGATDFAGTVNKWSHGAAFNNSFPFGGCMSNVYVSPGDYFDFTVESNRRKFVTAGLEPVNLGVNGENPTGVQPVIWLPTGDPTSSSGSIDPFTLENGTAISNCVI